MKVSGKSRMVIKDQNDKFEKCVIMVCGISM